MSIAFIIGQSIHLSVFVAVIWMLWPWMPWKKQPRHEGIIDQRKDNGL